jgi:hypothetical protein
MIGGECQAFKE